MTEACDHCGVIRTLNRFVQAQDDGDFDRVMECCTDDVRMEVVGFPTGGVYEGKERVHEMMSGVRGMTWAKGWFKGPQKGRKHFSINPVVTVDGDRAEASTDFLMCILENPDEGGVVGLIAGRYLDELRREDGEWLISVRKLVAEIPGIAQEHGPPHELEAKAP